MEDLESYGLLFSFEAVNFDGLDLRIVRLECNCHMSTSGQNAYIFNDLGAFLVMMDVQ